MAHDWPVDVNFTKAATKYKVAQCVSKNLNGDWGFWGTCEEYYAGLSTTTSKMKHVTADDISAHCSSLKSNWKADEVKEYCEKLVSAQNQYWENRSIPWLTEQDLERKGRTPMPQT